MKQIRIISGIALLTVALVLAGCGKKNTDFPDPLGVAAPTSVSSLAVIDVSSGPAFDYDLSWTIDDPSKVQFYRVYSSFDGATFALSQDTIPPGQTTAQLSSLIPVASFGVSVVNPDNVEGAMVTEPTP